jgi:predicted nucleotidyltransferase
MARRAHVEAAAIAAATARDRILIAAKGGGMEASGDQLAALLDLARALDDASIGYALIGGIAVGIQSGSPRATADVDIAVPSTVAREALVSTLATAGFQHRGEFAHSINFRHPSGEPVQVAFDESFDPMIARAEEVEVSGVVIRVVSKEDLIEMKRRAAGDPARRRSKALRDQADVELLRGDVPEPDEGW